MVLNRSGSVGQGATGPTSGTGTRRGSSAVSVEKDLWGRVVGAPSLPPAETSTFPGGRVGSIGDHPEYVELNLLSPGDTRLVGRQGHET